MPHAWFKVPHDIIMLLKPGKIFHMKISQYTNVLIKKLVSNVVELIYNLKTSMVCHTASSRLTSMQFFLIRHLIRPVPPRDPAMGLKKVTSEVQSFLSTPDFVEAIINVVNNTKVFIGK